MRTPYSLHTKHIDMKNKVPKHLIVLDVFFCPLPTPDPTPSPQTPPLPTSASLPVVTRSSRSPTRHIFHTVVCSEHYQSGATTSGVYCVDPDGNGSFLVYCDMTTDGGGWTVFQRRRDGSQDFHLGWGEYKVGFGNLTGEFWLGLDKIHRLTASRPSELRVDIEDWSGNNFYAKYGDFVVGDEKSLYRLSAGSYSGSAGDSFLPHDNFEFSTNDRDNDGDGEGSCAERNGGGWWFRSCHPSNLNGFYLGNKKSWRGVIWYKNMGTLSLKFSEMKLRETN